MILDEEFPFLVEDLRSTASSSRNQLSTGSSSSEDHPEPGRSGRSSSKISGLPTTFSDDFVRSLSDPSDTVHQPHYYP
jgi:hypothetical protein